MLDKIRAEIAQIEPYDLPWDKRTPERIRDMALEIVEKYAEQEPTIRPSFSYTAEIKADDEQLERLQGILNGEMVLRVEQEPCDDVVSRQAVLEIVNNPLNIRLDEIIKKLPPVRPQETVTEFADRCRECGAKYGKLLKQEPNTGHWIGIDEEPHEDYECDKCGYVVSTYTANIEPHTEYKYCPNCGARMFEPQESEDKK